ncbi:trimeric LpxA-like protein [Westerdykella ornata]|uniref:Dynactin subunit 6 n=1 Tax=Westerdykella ornata TaxID=318751 RepID=A0A6A6JJL9_WESOR|nr:trimeric LpxA-like protein [Westerdykella ornata]KAF2276781.1 trimeric LpxA-like protein [Westerdykella ornata]
MSVQPTPSRPASERRTSSMQKRQSILPRPPSLIVDPSVLIAQHVQIAGANPITIGPNAIIHPHTKISSAMAPVVIGEGVIAFEKVKIGVGMGESGIADSRRSSVMSPGNRDSLRGEGTVLGRNVVIETGAVVEAAEVGEGTVVEVGAVLGPGCVVGRYCTITPTTILPPNTHIPDFTVVYSGTEKRVDNTLQSRPELLEARALVHKKQIDMFKRLVPNNIAKWA